MSTLEVPSRIVLTSAQVSQVLNGVDGFGVDWSVDPEQFSGWGSPASTFAPVQKQRGAGSYLSPRDLTSRSLGVGGLVEASDADGLRDAFDRLEAACDLDACTLAVDEGNSTRTLTCYRQDEVLRTDITDTLAKWSIGMTAPDPLKYGPTVTSASTALPSTSGGLTFPATFPVVITGATTTGVVHIETAGNVPRRVGVPLKLRIDGPIVGPRVMHAQSGRTLALDYSLPAGSWLEFDMANRKVREGGTALRNTFVTERGWFLLAPGANDLIFGADAPSTNARLTVTYAPAYL